MANSSLSNPTGIEFGDDDPPFLKYFGQSSFFGGTAPLNIVYGYLIVLGFGAVFSIFTTALVYLEKYFAGGVEMTSEQFNTAGRTVKTGLIASVIVSQWTWAATILQSSNVAWQYGVSGPFWYASGATVQVILFGVLAISIKKVAPSAHTLCEIVNARWGRTAHKTFLFFAFSANIIVTSMLLLGGAATTEALTGIDYRLASFLIPWGVILYTAEGGLKATFISTYFHTVLIFAVLIIMVFIVYIKVYSSDQIYKFLDTVANFSEDDCSYLYQNGTDSFYAKGTYACGYVSGNNQGSYLTMLSSGGLMFGIINIVGNFGTVFVDNSYWQSAIAARPDSAAVGYLLGGLCWFAVPFSLATSLGLTSVALMLPVTATEAGEGLVPPAVAVHLLGDAGAALILIMLFMAITSTGSAESIAVSSLVTYDIYREYINPEASGADILRISKYIIVIFGLFSGCFALLLHEIGLNLGWVYLFMGIIIGPAVFPLWFMMTWKGASGTGAILAAWGGLILAVITWLVAAQIQGGKITVDTLGTNEVMLSGNLVAILSSGFIHWFWSVFVDKTDYDFNELDKNIRLVEADTSGITADDLNPEELDRVYKWITRRGYVVSFILIFVWPVLSIPAGKFTESYFAFWVLVSIAWGFAGGIVVTILPITESFDEIANVFVGIYNTVVGNPISSSAGEVVSTKENDDEPDIKSDPVVSRVEEEVDA